MIAFLFSFQIHTINGDAKCQDLLTLLEKDRAKEFTTQRQQIAYRMEAEGIIGAEDPLYRLEWVSQNETFPSSSYELTPFNLTDT